MQKDSFRTIQKLFLISLLLPILNPLYLIFLEIQDLLFVIILANIIIYVLWIIMFNKIGVEIHRKSSKFSFLIFYLITLSIPIIYICFELKSKIPLEFLIVNLIVPRP